MYMYKNFTCTKTDDVIKKCSKYSINPSRAGLSLSPVLCIIYTQYGPSLNNAYAESGV